LTYTKKNISEDKFTFLLDFLADPVVIVNEKGHFLLVNSAFEKVTGLSEKEVIGKSFLEMTFLTAESKTALVENLKRRLAGLSPEPYDITFMGKSGEVRQFEVKATRTDSAGQPADLVIFRDVTQRRNNERRLKEYAEKMEALVDEKVREIKESEEKFRAISTSAMDAIVLVDDTGKIVYWNPTAERIFGYTKEEAVGKEMEKLLIPPQHRRFYSKFAKKLANKEQIHKKTIEFKALRKDGTEFPIELSATALKLRNKLCLLGIVRDVSERRKMEADVKQKLDMLEALTENLGVGFVIISKDYRVLWVNRFVKNNVGDVEGKQCYATLNTLDHICPDCGVKKVFEEGVTRDAHEYSQIGVHGNMYHVELIATPLKDKDGNITAALEFVVDIAEKKRMQSKLTEYSQKLEKLVEERTEQLQQTQAKLIKSERLAAIGELAGMVGHDLRNPLTGIKNATYYLKKKGSACTDDNRREMLEIIENAIEHANTTINDLLDYSREMHLELAECSPTSLLKGALSIVQIPDHIEIIDYTLNKPTIRTDAVKMERVFINLIKNAIDAMTKKGTLEIRSTQTNGNVEIAFADTGIGVPENIMPKLFTPLTTTKAQGMGFGLAICKRIVEAHDGKITVESVMGKGATFTITLPIEPKLKDGGENEWVIPQESLLSMTTKA